MAQNRYEILWQEGKMPMQRLAKKLQEIGLIPEEMDYKSSEAVQMAIQIEQLSLQLKKQWQSTQPGWEEEKPLTLEALIEEWGE